MRDEPEKSVVLGDTALQSDVLESLASAVKYRQWLTDLARPHLGKDPIELGSGLGDYAETWLDAGLPAITLTELDPSRLDYLTARFDGDDRVRVTKLDVFDPGEAKHSSYVAFNVLEHIEDQVAALRAAHQLLEPGGAVVIFVPAFNFLMSRFDRSVGHVRRYTKRSLAEAYQSAGLEMVAIRYVNAPGVFAWFVGMRLLRMTPSDGLVVRLWDRFVIPIARAIERRVRPPFGQSVFAVGRVPN
jgi:hypothetical protein